MSLLPQKSASLRARSLPVGRSSLAPTELFFWKQTWPLPPGSHSLVTKLMCRERQGDLGAACWPRCGGWEGCAAQVAEEPYCRPGFLYRCCLAPAKASAHWAHEAVLWQAARCKCTLASQLVRAVPRQGLS